MKQVVLLWVARLKVDCVNTSFLEKGSICLVLGQSLHFCYFCLFWYLWHICHCATVVCCLALLHNSCSRMRCRVTWSLPSRASAIFTSFWHVNKYTNTQIHKHTPFWHIKNTQIHKYANTHVHIHSDKHIHQKSSQTNKCKPAPLFDTQQIHNYTK